MQEHTTTRSGDSASPALDDALEFARDAHSGQTRRQDGRPFIEHPVAVTELLAEHDLADDLLAAGYLHDTVEKCDHVRLEDLEARFGADIAALVDALSEDPAIEAYDVRKRALREKVLSSGREAAIVYAADRLANMRDWRGLSAQERPEAATRLGTDLESRLALWAEDLRELTELDEELPFLAQIEVELRELG